MFTVRQVRLNEDYRHPFQLAACDKYSLLLVYVVKLISRVKFSCLVSYISLCVPGRAI